MNQTKVKRSFWRFGGKLDAVYNWLVLLFFVLSCLVQLGRFGGRSIPKALGVATGQTVVVAILLFVIFKIISLLARKNSSSESER